MQKIRLTLIRIFAYYGHMKKRLRKKLTKKFLAIFMCGSLEAPFFVSWSPSWHYALRPGQLRWVLKITSRKFQIRCYKQACTFPADTFLDLIENRAAQSDEPQRLIPVYQLPPERVLRCA